VVPRRRGQAGRADGVGHALRDGQVGGQRLLHEEGQPRLDDRQLQVAVGEGRHAQPHRVQPGHQQTAQVSGRTGAHLGGQRLGDRGVRVAHRDELDVGEAGQRPGVPGADTARPDQADPDGHEVTGPASTCTGGQGRSGVLIVGNRARSVSGPLTSGSRRGTIAALELPCGHRAGARTTRGRASGRWAGDSAVAGAGGTPHAR
jgi:hypothetical protein